MKIHIDPVISSRIKQAWGALDPALQSRIAPILARANQQALTVSQTRTAPPFDPSIPHQALLARTAISNDRDPVVASLAPGVVIDIGPGGEIWGTGKYQQLDPGWAESVAVWLEYFVIGKNAFNNAPPVIQIPNSVQVAIAGDWGTGDWRTDANPAPSTDVARHIKFLHPHITIHLGDVYYAGTSDQERHLLVNLWPPGSIGALTLNSNHEMYSGAKPYFRNALTNPLFGMQKKCSYFALENADWIIVGLDSAYHANEEGMYMDGSLFPENGPQDQLNFLRAQVAKNKKIIMLTHHNGLSEDGSNTTRLWDQVMRAFPEGSAPAFWYWGHVHAGVVYNSYANVNCRCCGHGGIPWGQASMLKESPNVAWYEHRSANDPDLPQRVLNGFAILDLDGANLKELFYDENGGIAWP